MSTLEDLDVQIKELVKQRRALALEQGKPLVLEKLAPLFDKYPIRSVYWYQYTPSFCDGDPCEFSVYFEPYFNYDPETDFDYPEDYDHVFDAWKISWVWKTENHDADLSDEYVSRNLALKRAREDEGWTDSLVESLSEDVKELRRWVDEHEDLFREIFGESVSVSISRDGEVRVDEYYAD